MACALAATGCGPLLGLDDDVRLVESSGGDPGCACADDNPCTEDLCDDGSCVHRPLGDGAAPEQLAGDCRVVMCQDGQARSAPEPSDEPPDTDCALAGCSGADVVYQPVASGTACDEQGGSLCDGAGLCVECLDHGDCTSPATCGGGGLAGFCGCTPLACSDVAQTCGTVSDGCGGELECNNALVDGEETDVDCGGPVESCALRCRDGDACTFGTDCKSGFCAGSSCDTPWSSSYGDGAVQHATAVASDAAGNLIVAGEFTGTIDFGAGPLSSGEGGWELFVVELDPAGHALWSRQFGAGALATVRDVAVDAAGNIVLVGSFNGLLDFGAGALDSGSGSQGYVAKLDDFGNALWSMQLSSDGSVSDAVAVTIRNNGRIVVAGSYQGFVTVDDVALGSVDGSDAYVLELTTAGALGSFAKSLGGAGQQRAVDVVASSSGPLAVAGDFTGSLVVGGKTHQGKGDWDVFVALLEQNGEPLWSRALGHTGPQNAAAVAVDEIGRVTVAGSYFDGIDLGGGVIPSAGADDLFVARLDAGGAVSWANRYGDAQSQAAVGLAVDAQSDIVVTGNFTGSIAFGPTALVSAGGADVYVAKLDASGGTMWSRRFGDASAQLVREIAVTPHGGVVVIGDYQGSIDFGQGVLSSAGGGDVFVGALPP